jgi:hypothetical protein
LVEGRHELASLGPDLFLAQPLSSQLGLDLVFEVEPRAMALLPGRNHLVQPNLAAGPDGLVSTGSMLLDAVKSGDRYGTWMPILGLGGRCGAQQHKRQSDDGTGDPVSAPLH